MPSARRSRVTWPRLGLSLLVWLVVATAVALALELVTGHPPSRPLTTVITLLLVWPLYVRYWRTRWA